MEETVVNAPEPATVFAFGPEDAPVDEVQPEAEPAGEEAQESEQQTVEAEESAEGVDAQLTEQEKVNRAIGKEKHRIREQARQEYQQKLESDPARQLGQLMIEDLMTNKGLSADDAAKEATENLLKAIAKREGMSVGMTKKLFGKEVKQAVSEAADQQSEIDRIVADVQAAEKPEGFDESAAYQDEAFLDLLREMPAKAAIRVYMAEKKASQAGQDIAEKLKARQAIPQSSRPQQAVTPKTDWMNASKEEFLAEKARRQKYR
jgi:hypothetical protein